MWTVENALQNIQDITLCNLQNKAVVSKIHTEKRGHLLRNKKEPGKVAEKGFSFITDRLTTISHPILNAAGEMTSKRLKLKYSHEP